VLEDGTLVDVRKWTSAGTGFPLRLPLVPFAVTRAVWGAIETMPEHLEGIAEVRGRPHDVLWLTNLVAHDRAQGGEAAGPPCHRSAAAKGLIEHAAWRDRNG
jgi:hypothetical protein